MSWFDDSLLVQGPKKVASGKVAMVATQHPEVTKEMVKVLKEGGNAVDATIMSCLLQNVYEPHMSNHAGTIDFLYYEEETGKSSVHKDRMVYTAEYVLWLEDNLQYPAH